MSRDYYVERLMGERGESLAPLFQTLARNVAAHPYVLCHRDFHGQNIHVVGDEIYLIDFQDLRMGPDTYDLASLLRDRGVARIIGDETELELVDHYAGGRNVRHRYFETLLQRSIKILGTFSKQPIERGRMHYLDFIPPTIESIRRCLRELPEYAALERLLPMEFSVNEAKNRIAERRS
jgi:aminoglycoside/choline kinase family phosphotransferase